MVTSSYMPDVVCHIAFNAGFQTPAASRVWTNVSGLVELDKNITIKVGKTNEQSSAEANVLTITLDNTDGRFTPEKPSSIFYPNVQLDKPIRVQYTPVDGSVTIRFVGFITEWPVSWEDTDGRSLVTLTASSRIARLALSNPLKSIVENVYLKSRPLGYYPLGEPAGSTQANDVSGRNTNPLVATGDPAADPVVFGSATGPGTDSLTAATFSSTSKWLLGTNPTSETSNFFSSLPAMSYECFFSRTGAPTTKESIATWGWQWLVMDTSGQIMGMQYETLSSPMVTSPNAYNDGHVHHAALVVTNTSPGSTADWELFIDGVSVAVATAMPNYLVAGDMYVGSNRVTAGNFGAPKRFNGSVSHFAVYDRALTATEILEHMTAGSTGFAGDDVGTRFTRYANYIGIDPTDLNLESSAVLVQHIDTTGKQPLELMQLLETTEGGTLFDGRDGRTTLHNRSHRFGASSLYTLDLATGVGENDYSPRLDRTNLLNRITVEDNTGNVSVTVEDATSQTAFGLASDSITTLSQDDDDPLFMANWFLLKYKTPTSRVPTLTVKMLDQVGGTPNSAAIASTDVGSRITVTNRPAADSTTTINFFVEGYTEVIGPESIDFTFNLSPGSPDDQALMIGDAVRGVIGTNPVAL